MSAGQQDPSRAPVQERSRGLGPVHLLWALPVALAAALVLTLLAGIAACGVSGCSGGGFGPVTDRQPLAAVMLLVAGVILAAPLVLVRWTRSRAVRVVVAVVVALGWAIWAWFAVTG